MTESKIQPEQRLSTTAPREQARAAQRFVYTNRDWDAEAYRVYGEGRNPAPCPICRRTGFYGPRVAPGDRHYRQCRFCGFTQDADGAPQEFRPIVHDCAEWPTVARAPYTWFVPMDASTFHCSFCQGHADVETLIVKSPVQDASHPWWKVPQHRTRFYYSRFWENWECTKGRVFL